MTPLGPTWRSAAHPDMTPHGGSREKVEAGRGGPHRLSLTRRHTTAESDAIWLVPDESCIRTARTWPTTLMRLGQGGGSIRAREQDRHRDPTSRGPVRSPE
jgi:hypothetical protein